MRFSFGDHPSTLGPPSETNGWRSIRGPRPSAGYPLAAILGILLLTVLVGGLILLGLVSPTGGQASPDPDSHFPWGSLIFTLVLFIPLHELAHLIFHPGGGRSPQSMVMVWPARLRVGVYYEGRMSRRRWSVMRAAPFLVFALVPALILASTRGIQMGPDLSVALQLLMLLNALGSGADALALILVLRQVPSRAQLWFRSGMAYLRMP